MTCVTIEQPHNRGCDCSMVTQITLKTEVSHGLPSDTTPAEVYTDSEERQVPRGGHAPSHSGLPLRMAGQSHCHWRSQAEGSSSSGS